MEAVRDPLRGIVSHDGIDHGAQKRHEGLDAIGFLASAEGLDVAGPLLEREVEDVHGLAQDLEESVDAMLLDQRIGIFLALQIEGGHGEPRRQQDLRGTKRGGASGVIAVVRDDNLRRIAAEGPSLPDRQRSAHRGDDSGNTRMIERAGFAPPPPYDEGCPRRRDRNSTRLNSSPTSTSYSR